MVSYFTENQEFLVNSSFFLIKVKFLLFDRVWSIIKKNTEFWQIIQVKDDHIKYESQKIKYADYAKNWADFTSFFVQFTMI